MKNELAVARQMYAQCVFNHKVHEKACERLESTRNKIKIINIFDLFLILLFLVLQIYFPTNSIFGAISIGLTVFEITFLFMQKEFPFDEKSKEHKRIALRFLSLRDQYLAHISELMSDSIQLEAIKFCDSLMNNYHLICDLAPQTTYKDYQNAQITLLGMTKNGEEYTWSNAEIDRFLPETMRLA